MNITPMFGSASIQNSHKTQLFGASVVYKMPIYFPGLIIKSKETEKEKKVQQIPRISSNKTSFD